MRSFRYRHIHNTLATLGTAVLLATVVSLPACGKPLPKLPTTPIAVAVTSADNAVREGGLTALGYLKATGKVAVRAQRMEIGLANDGLVPAALHQQIQTGFRDMATFVLAAITQIEKGVVTTWASMRALIDPALAKVQALIDVIDRAGAGLARVKEFVLSIWDMLTDAGKPSAAGIFVPIGVTA